jgi:hypothetical protein
LPCSSWNPTTSAPCRRISSAAQRARTGPDAIPGFFPVAEVWLLPSTLNELSAKSSVGSAAGARLGSGAVVLGVETGAGVALGLVGAVGVGRDVSVTAGARGPWVVTDGAGRVGAAAVVCGGGADPVKDAWPGCARTASPRPAAMRTATQLVVTRRATPRVHFTNERYREHRAGFRLFT